MLVLETSLIFEVILYFVNNIKIMMLVNKKYKRFVIRLVAIADKKGIYFFLKAFHDLFDLNLHSTFLWI